MYLYAALLALLCISFSSGATTTTPTTTSTTTSTTTTATTTTTPTNETTPTTTTTSTTTTPTNTTTSTTTTTPTNATTPTTTTTLTTTTTPTNTTTSTQEPTSTTAQPKVLIEKSDRKCSREGLASDVLELGCWGYKRCVNNTVVTYSCLGNTVLERDSMTCVSQGTGATDCKKEVSCEGVPDGKYADRDTGCQSYYQCWNGYDFPHIYCPKSLHFNEEIQNCDYQYNIKPPCGTKDVPQ